MTKYKLNKIYAPFSQGYDLSEDMGDNVETARRIRERRDNLADLFAPVCLHELRQGFYREERRKNHG